MKITIQQLSKITGMPQDEIVARFRHAESLTSIENGTLYLYVTAGIIDAMADVAEAKRRIEELQRVADETELLASVLSGGEKI